MDAAVGSCDETGETPVVTRSQKEFLRDLLLAQGIQKTPGSELEDLLARCARAERFFLFSRICLFFRSGGWVNIELELTTLTSPCGL